MEGEVRGWVKFLSKIAILVKAPPLGKNYLEGPLSAYPSIIFWPPPRAHPQFEGLTETLPPKSLTFCVILDNKNCVNFNALGEDSHSALQIEDGPEEGIKKIIEG